MASSIICSVHPRYKWASPAAAFAELELAWFILGTSGLLPAHSHQTAIVGRTKQARIPNKWYAISGRFHARRRADTSNAACLD